ncbi:MAG: FAD-binding oxidoreductase [Candidatus Heimdallarchaeota archaeon]|nr:FAD-binding oxidoreductase [Candidatus Heimdallarchaeota archaeon]MCK4770584.1 FAD-binding oxidoreductase [Candidatus Heimdallarchaeota archaeon]
MSENVIVTNKVETSPFEDVRSVKGDKVIAESYPGYLVDESKISGGHAEWLLFPTNENEIVSIINKMKEENQAITISAARTGIVGSAVPLLGGAVVSLERMDDFIGLGYDEEDSRWFVRVQPNITLNEINEIVKLKKIEENQSIPPEKNWIGKFNEEPTMFYPIDPTEMTASIGGCIAANASGARTFKYGATREWVRRLRVIISTGEVLEIPRGKYKAKDGVFIIKTAEQEFEFKVPSYQLPKAKNAAGLYTTPEMDLIDLFIGSEGIFGFITEADVWLKEYIPHISNVAFFTNEVDAIKFVTLLRSSSKFKPEFMEYFDNNSLTLLRDTQKVDPKFVNMPNIPEEANTAISFDLGYKEDALEETFKEIGLMLEECNSSLKDTWSAYEERELDRFKHFRHAVPEIVNNIIAERKKKYPSIHKLGTDMSVEDEYIGEMMEFYHKILNEVGLEYVIWGHIGDNHVHVNILPRNMEDLELGKQLYKKFAQKAVSFGGSVSAEHGIGKIKHEYLEIMFGNEAINEMRQVKTTLDPNFLFNPGNIFSKEVS